MFSSHNIQTLASKSNINYKSFNEPSNFHSTSSKQLYSIWPILRNAIIWACDRILDFRRQTKYPFCKTKFIVFTSCFEGFEKKTTTSCISAYIWFRKKMMRNRPRWSKSCSIHCKDFYFQYLNFNLQVYIVISVCVLI